MGTNSDDASEGAPPPQVAAALVDRRGVVLGWSRAAERLVERPAAEVLRRSVLRLLADRDAAPAGRPPDHGTTRLRCGSGKTVTVRYRTDGLRNPELSLILAVDADRAAEAEWGAALTEALLGQERVGFVLRDTDLAVVRTNLARGAHVGPSLPVGSRLPDVMHPADAADAEAGLRGVLETGVPFAGHEQRVRSARPPYGEWSFSVSAVRTQDAQGRPTGVAVLLTDATKHWRAERRRELRHRASAGIGSTLDIGRTAQDVVDALVPDFADIAWVDLADAALAGEEPPKTFGGGDLHLRRTAVRSAKEPWPSGLLPPGAPVPPFPDLAMVRELQEGRTIVTDRETLRRGLRDPDHLRLAAPEDGHSMIAAPLFARGLVLGLVAGWRTDRPEPFEEEDATLLAEIASHAALGVDNARRYTREHRAAVTLQRRLLPQAGTSTRVMETTGVYVPAEVGAEVGGDWFDAIKLPSLRTALVVGDVTGHGLHATATMGRLRTAVQTLADLELSPDELLTHLDDLVSRLAGEADPAQRDVVGATCLVAVHDPVAGRCTMAAAGHPPPLLALPDGRVAPVTMRPGPPLGVGGLPFEATIVDMPPDSVLVLYTDGLLQRYGVDVGDPIREVTDLLTRLRPSGGDLAEIAQALMTGSGAGPPRDDAAVLVARTASLGEDSVAHWEFPADPRAVASARETATGKLAEWGLEGNAFVTELIVSELVTNAVRYAGGPVGLRLIRDEALFCEVTDPSNTQPRMRRARISDEGGRGLFLVAQLSRRWGSRYGQTGKTIWVEQELSA
ncbi:SpoIIE family protein phosphatase [Streptomyces zaomyceticus]|uniref:ATP-binding SpoIIE family protein phosphatase n=1 Tax=Streptomyces zaomyceticus TaxID=68286 RepID=UPI002E164624|nr:SpoIIE family protein phosphatase [Streptomyces zaomyceticus]